MYKRQTQGCVVQGEVKHSVLFTGVKIGAGARIIDSVLMPGVVVEEGAVVPVSYTHLMISSASPVLRTFSILLLRLSRTLSLPRSMSKLSLVTPTIR